MLAKKRGSCCSALSRGLLCSRAPERVLHKGTISYSKCLFLKNGDDGAIHEMEDTVLQSSCPNSSRYNDSLNESWLCWLSVRRGGRRCSIYIARESTITKHRHLFIPFSPIFLPILNLNFCNVSSLLAVFSRIRDRQPRPNIARQALLEWQRLGMVWRNARPIRQPENARRTVLPICFNFSSLGQARPCEYHDP